MHGRAELSTLVSPTRCLQLEMVPPAVKYEEMLFYIHQLTTYFLAGLVPTAGLGSDSCVSISDCILHFKQHTSNMGAGLSEGACKDKLPTVTLSSYIYTYPARKVQCAVTIFDSQVTAMGAIWRTLTWVDECFQDAKVA